MQAFPYRNSKHKAFHGWRLQCIGVFFFFRVFVVALVRYFFIAVGLLRRFFVCIAVG